MRKILITNDDGIDSEGLLRLVKVAVKYGEVWVVAPESQRSATAHAITLRTSFDVYPAEYPVEGVKAYVCSGTPADCVRMGSVFLLDRKPDVVFSGINFGFNTATDIQYSGTVGAAFEAEFQGARAIAFSEKACDIHEVTDKYLDEMISKYIDKEVEPGQIININFPGCKLSECKGVMEDVTVSESMFYTDRYKKVEDLENGGMRVMVDGIYGEECEEGSDMWAVVHNYIAVGVVNNYK